MKNNLHKTYYKKEKQQQQHIRAFYRNRFVLLFSLLILLICSCEKLANWPITELSKNIIVVDGMITDEAGIHTIKINELVPGLNIKPTPVTTATVSIICEDSIYFLKQDSIDSGLYNTKSTFFGEVGKTYTLKITNKDKVYTATATMIPTANFNPVQYTKNSGNETYHIDYVAGPFSSNRSSMWEIHLDWSMVAGFENLDPKDNKARLLYYTIPTLDVSEMFAPDFQKVSFPAGTIIQETRYSLTPEHARFIRALLSETNWRGGLFDSTPANLPTNLSEGAVGYFSACAVEKISLTVTK